MLCQQPQRSALKIPEKNSAGARDCDPRRRSDRVNCCRSRRRLRGGHNAGNGTKRSIGSRQVRRDVIVTSHRAPVPPTCVTPRRRSGARSRVDAGTKGSFLQDSTGVDRYRFRAECRTSKHHDIMLARRSRHHRFSARVAPIIDRL